jgi:hypothetical protein
MKLHRHAKTVCYWLRSTQLPEGHFTPKKRMGFADFLADFSGFFSGFFKKKSVGFSGFFSGFFRIFSGFLKICWIFQICLDFPDLFGFYLFRICSENINAYRDRCHSFRCPPF